MDIEEEYYEEDIDGMFPDFPDYWNVYNKVLHYPAYTRSESTEDANLAVNMEVSFYIIEGDQVLFGEAIYWPFQKYCRDWQHWAEFKPAIPIEVLKEIILMSLCSQED